MTDGPIEVELWRTRRRSAILTHARVYLTDAAHLTSGINVDADAVWGRPTRTHLTLGFAYLNLNPRFWSSAPRQGRNLMRTLRTLIWRSVTRWMRGCRGAGGLWMRGQLFCGLTDTLVEDQVQPD